MGAATEHAGPVPLLPLNVVSTPPTTGGGVGALPDVPRSFSRPAPRSDRLLLFEAPDEPEGAEARMASAASSRQLLYESLEGLKTARRRSMDLVETPLAASVSRRSSTAALTLLRDGESHLQSRNWREGAGRLLLSLAHNSDDDRAAYTFREALDHLRRDRAFWDPTGWRRGQVDYGPDGPRRARSMKPVKRRPARTIVDDFPQQWNAARMEEVIRGRAFRIARPPGVEGPSPEEELAELRPSLHKDYYIPLRTIFRFYSRLDGSRVKAIAVRSRKFDAEEAHSMSKHEFDAFVTDCKLVVPTTSTGMGPSSHVVLSKPRVNLIFLMANKGLAREDGDPYNSAPPAAMLESANKNTLGLCNFLQAVVRLADIKYAYEAGTLNERFEMMMERDVLPNARWDDVQEFRRLIKHPDIQAAIAGVKPTIRTLFDKYCDLDYHQARIFGSHKNNSVSLREFMTLFMDLGLLKSGVLTGKDVQDAFATAQADPTIDDDVTEADDHGVDSMEELNRVEFEEAMVRCAVAMCYGDGQGDRGRGGAILAPVVGRRASQAPRPTFKSLSKNFRRSLVIEAPDGTQVLPARPASEATIPAVAVSSDGPEGSDTRVIWSSAALPALVAAVTSAGSAPPTDRRPSLAGGVGEEGAGREEGEDARPEEIARAIRRFFEEVKQSMERVAAGKPPEAPAATPRGGAVSNLFRPRPDEDPLAAAASSARSRASDSEALAAGASAASSRRSSLSMPERPAAARPLNGASPRAALAALLKPPAAGPRL